MSSLPGATAGPDGEPPMAESEPMLPLRELDRALAPIRRVVGYALQPGGSGRVRYLGANLAPHAARALALDLPGALRESLAFVAAQLDGFDAAADDDRRERLSGMFAALTRIDALAGLPVPQVLRPVHKVLQVDVAEPEPAPTGTEPSPGRAAPSVPTTGPSVAAAGSVAATNPAPDDEDDDEDEDEGDEFAGDLGHPLAELVPDLAEAFAAASIETVRDLVLRRPAVAETLTPIHGAGREIPDGRAAAGGRIRASYTVYRGSAVAGRWSVVVGAGPLRVRWAEPAPEGWREVDRRVVVAGTYGDGALLDAELASADDRGVRLASWGIPGVPDHRIRQVLTGLLDAAAQIRDPVSTDVLREVGLAGLSAALVSAHAQVGDEGRRRLAFDEALLAQLAGILPRHSTGRDRGIGHAVLHGFAGRMGDLHDLRLYDDAQAHLEDIKRDLRRASPMRRVLTGEVGAGKGKLALLAAAMVADAKSQVLVLGSDPVEAETRFMHTEPLLREGGLVARLVQTPPTRPQLDAIKRGEVHVVFGTLDLLEQPVEYRRLGLVIAIERESFGRVGVLHAALPAPRPDLLVSTAIPVGPRVLLTAYADHHVSVVVDPERRPARIELCRADERPAAYQQVRDAVASGDQALIVFPMVDGADAIDLPDALRLVRVLEAEAFAGLRVGLLHGGIPRDDRLRVHEDFVHRRIDVLVCTTRIEDGPTVPGAVVVVIEQADRVDQWRLHRIIGFMSRSRRVQEPGEERTPARAILIVGELAEPDAAARIHRVVGAPNGFQLTEALVQLRGVDRAVAAGAAPLPQFDWFELDNDLPLLLRAREEAHRVLRADPQLRRGSHADLGRELRARWDRLFVGGADRGWVCPIRDDAPVEPKRRRRRRRRRR